MGKSTKLLRKNVVSMRINDDESRRLQDLAAQTNVNVSTLLRLALNHLGMASDSTATEQTPSLKGQL